MSRDNSLPFERGATAYGLGATIDAANLKFDDLLGQVKDTEDIIWNDAGAKGNNSAAKVRVMAVRNKTGGAVTPGQAVELDPEAPFTIKQTAQTATIPPVFVDEYLPSAGCPANDVCWVVIQGPCNAKLLPGNAADQAGGTFWLNDGTNKGVVAPYTPADDKAIRAFHAGYGATWNMVTVAKNAGTVNGRIFVRSKYAT